MYACTHTHLYKNYRYNYLDQINLHITSTNTFSILKVTHAYHQLHISKNLQKPRPQTYQPFLDKALRLLTYLLC